MKEDLKSIINKLCDIVYNGMDCRVCRFQEYCENKVINCESDFCDMIYDIKAINDEWEEE